MAAAQHDVEMLAMPKMILLQGAGAVVGVQVRQGTVEEESWTGAP